MTFGKALGSSLVSPVVGGDIVYIGAGIYRETVLISNGSATNFPSPASVVQFIGDTDGSHTGDAGEIIVTNYTTNDSTAAASGVIINFNSRGNLTFDSITLISGSPSNVLLSNGAVANCANVTFKRCFLYGREAPVLSLTCVTDTNMNWLFEKCIVVAPATHMALTCPTSTVADYTIGFTLKNCLFISPTASNILSLTGSGAGAFKPGGASVYNCTFFGTINTIITNTAGGFSTTIPITVYNCLFYNGSNRAVNAATLGQIVEDYNYFTPDSPRINVTAGTHSKVGNVLYPGIEIGQGLLYGFIGRPLAMPTTGSPLLGFGNSGSVTAPTDDLLGRARPEGGASTSNAIGALERHDTAVKETSVTRTGTGAIKLVGPGSQEFNVPVDASATVLSVYCQYDTTHGTTNPPQMILTNGGEIGVADQTITATTTTGAYLQLSTASFTPTAKGIVTIRLVSRSAGAAGIAYFDDFNIV